MVAILIVYPRITALLLGDWKIQGARDAARLTTLDLPT
jgi:hypothetical protein